ncbi:MAG: FkbM family methyltransferase, partial [Waterburya sp.]
ISIDDFCRISGFKPNLIKIDVEGYQAKILPGAIKTIETEKPIIILEFDGKQQLSKFNTTNKLITKPLFDLGYSCYWCKEQRNFHGGFQQLNYDNFTEEHEINSLSIFIP